jgi:hypothetical protein
MLLQRVTLPRRWVTYSEKVFVSYPSPPPKEYLSDGVTPKTYPLHQKNFKHGIEWERWTFRSAGLFHTVYHGEFSHNQSWFKAWVKSLPVWVSFPLLLSMFWTLSYSLLNFRYIGVKPKRFTPEWIAAMKERERAENTNPVSRYMDRRRRERGMHFVLGNVLPYHQYFLWMRNSHDYAVAEEMLARQQADQEANKEEEQQE